MENAILLQSGEFYSYLQPDQNKYTIEDVALGLSHICRFAGQLPFFYSVAQHAVEVSYAIEPGFELEGLMHDNVEAFLQDIPTPLKRLLPDYKAMERLHEKAMCFKFGIPYPMPKEVHKADIEVFGAEVLSMQPKGTNWDCLTGVTPYAKHIVPVGPELAREMFLVRYYELTEKERNNVNYV